MKPIISDLVERFETGRLSRRELIGGLTLLMAVSQAPAATAPAPAAAPELPGLVGNGIDHVSVLVSDLKRSAKFYQGLFGLSVLSEDQEHGILRLGRQRVSVSLRKEQPYGTVDHFGVSVESFNKEAVTQVLTQRGLTPQENWQYGFHIKDPDGMVVQLL